MRYILVSFLLLINLAASAKADELSVDDVYALLSTGDIEALEEGLEDVYVAVKADQMSFDAQREFYDAFSTTHPEYGEVIDQWLDQYPNSIHARAAKGWQYYHLGWMARGEQLGNYVYPAAMEQARGHWKNFDEIMADIYSDDPEFVPASDGVLRSFQFGGNKAEILDVMAEVMAATPNKGSLDRAMRSAGPRWGGSEQLMQLLCNKYAQLADAGSGYDAQSCFAEALLVEIPYGDARKKAFGLVQAFPPEHSPRAHLLAAISESSNYRPSAEQMIDWEKQTREYNDLDERIAWTIENEYGVEGFLADYRSDKIEFVERERQNDPYNWNVLLYLAERKFGFDEDYLPTPGAIAAIEDAIVVGYRNPDVWLARIQFQPGRRDAASFPAIKSSYEKAIVYSNYHPGNLEKYFNELNAWYSIINRSLETPRSGFEQPTWSGMSDDPDKQIAELECGLVRAARIMLAVCEATPGARITCNPQGPSIQEISSFVSDEPDHLCPAMQEAEFLDLLYPEQP